MATIQQKLTDGHVATIPLSQILTTRFKNPRSFACEEELATMENSLIREKQLQNIMVSDSVDGDTGPNAGKFEVFGGWKRTECLRRIALSKLINEYNKEMNFSEDDPGYIHCRGKGFASHSEREKIRTASPEWAKKYDDALSSVMVNVLYRVVEDDQDARVKSHAENEQRSDAPLLDRMLSLQDLIRAGVPKNRIAATFSGGSSAMSQMSKLLQFMDHFKDAVEKNVSLPEEKKALASVILELERRLKIPAQSDEYDKYAVKMSHMRDLSYAALSAKKPMDFRRCVVLVCALAGYSAKPGEPITDKGAPPPQYGDFKEMIVMAVKASENPDIAVETPDDILGVGEVTIAGAATPIATQAATGTAPSAPVTTPVGVDPAKEGRIAAANDPTPLKPIPASLQQTSPQLPPSSSPSSSPSPSSPQPQQAAPSLSDNPFGDAELDDVINQVSSSTDTVVSESLGASAGDSDDGSAEGEIDEAALDITIANTGAMKTKMVTPAPVVVKPIESAKIIQEATRCMSIFGDPESNMIEKLGNISCASILFNLAQDRAGAADANVKSSTYFSVCDEYIAKLEEFFIRHATDEEKAALKTP